MLKKGSSGNFNNKSNSSIYPSSIIEPYKANDDRVSFNDQKSQKSSKFEKPVSLIVRKVQNSNT